jgi:hypothetical protein
LFDQYGFWPMTQAGGLVFHAGFQYHSVFCASPTAM